MGFFFQTLKGSYNSTIRGQMEPNFEFVRDIVVNLLTYKYEKDQSARVLTRLYFNFSDAQGQLIAVRDQIWQNFKFICTLMVVLITCKNDEDPI